MSLFVILDGHSGCGKSFIGNELKEYFVKKNYDVVFFDEDTIINQCINDDGLRVYDLYGLREQKYLHFKGLYDIIILEKSFIHNIIHHLREMPDDLITEFLQLELDHYLSGENSLQIYTLFRDYSNETVDLYLGLSHYLLENYGVDINCLPNSQDDRTPDLVAHIVKRIEWELD